MLPVDVADFERLEDSDRRDVGIEVVGPELDHALQQLAVRVDRSGDGRLGELTNHERRILAVKGEGRQVDRDERQEPCLAVGIAHRLGGELPLEVAVVSERAHPRHVLGRRADGHAAQRAASRRSARSSASTASASGPAPLPALRRRAHPTRAAPAATTLPHGTVDPPRCPQVSLLRFSWTTPWLPLLHDQFCTRKNRLPIPELCPALSVTTQAIVCRPFESVVVSSMKNPIAPLPLLVL